MRIRGSYLHLYTPAAKRVWVHALSAPLDIGDGGLGPLHLLWGWLQEGQDFLAGRKFTRQQLRNVREACGGDQVKPFPYQGHFIPFDIDSHAVLYRAAAEMLNRRSEKVDLEHLLLAMLYVSSPAKEILNEHGLHYHQISKAVPFRVRDADSAGDTLDYT